MKALQVSMKLALLLVVASLAACASTGGQRGASLARHDGPGAVDHRKMALVDYVARRKGVQVVWINPPMRDRQ